MRWRWISFLFLAVAIGLSFYFWPWGLLGSCILLIGAIWSFKVARHRNRIVGKGSEGEALVAKILDNLTMDARVIHSIQFESGHKMREIDHCLITHQAIFCIETKYLRGKIIGLPDDREWTLHKRARKTRSRYKRGFYNPLKQVATQIYHLRSYLESHLTPRWAQECSQIWIQGIVVFAHPQGDASSVTSAEHGVVTLDHLPKYLENYHPPTRAHRLSYGLRREIARLLTNETS
jgi:hypothetical protein